MKKIFSVAVLSFLTCILFTSISTPLQAQETPTVMGFDNNHDNKITYDSIANGSDDIFLRSASKREIDHLPANSIYFVDDTNHYFIPLSFEDLRKTDSNSDRRIDSKDPMYFGLYIGRFDPNNHEETITLAPLKDVGITALLLPAVVANPDDKTTHLEAVSKDGSMVLVQPVAWKF